jgi:hypothetical protein
MMQDFPSPGRNLNLGPLEYEEGVLRIGCNVQSKSEDMSPLVSSFSRRMTILRLWLFPSYFRGGVSLCL